MKRTTHTLAAALIVVLGGCGSFNNSFNSYHALPATPAAEATPATPDLGPDGDDTLPTVSMGVIQATPQHVIVESDKGPCDASPWPTPGHPPELPVKALQAAAGDVYAIERVERRHIDELRAYISERRRMQRESREGFEAKCTTVSK